MTATEVVAIVGAISTPVVAIAGYMFNERRAREDRTANRKLAEDSHVHERHLAEGAREHEESLRRNERLYNARRDTYLDLLRQLALEVRIVQRTDNPGSLLEPPEPPPEDEWADLRARVGAYGSPEVGAAVGAFDAAVRKFHEAAGKFVYVQEQVAPDAPPKGIGPHTPMDEFRAMEEARGAVEAAYEPVQTLVREELANL